MTERKYPIGVQSFRKLRMSNYSYIDKTHYIEPLLQGTAFFLSRPRRFGKSLFLSTLASYFRGEKELFKGLYIEEAEERMARAEGREPWLEHAVLYIDLNIRNYDSREVLIDRLSKNLSSIEEDYQLPNTDGAVEERFSNLIKTLSRKTGRKVVVLVDEYDKPLLHSLSEGDRELHEQYRKILAGFYVVLKSLDEYIRFAFLTGVTKFSKLSVFSGLNNLNDISLAPAYAGLCGITEAELLATFSEDIDALAQQLSYTPAELLAFLKSEYDGYCFSTNNVHVYNPFNVLNVFDKGILGSYWFATGTPTFLVEMLRDRQYDYPSLNKDVIIPLVELENPHEMIDDPIQVLYQAGYLTIKSFEPRERYFTLGFPNEEVRFCFETLLLRAFFSNRKPLTGNEGLILKQEIVRGNVEGFMDKIHTLLAALPYPTNANMDTVEWTYQSLFYLLFRLMGQSVRVEEHSIRGRADVVLETATTVYIFEFKLWSAGTPEEAIEQIRKQGYAEPYRSGAKPVRLIGVSFDTEKRNIGEWKEEAL
ncbi:MAG: ATP-binding protein [Bacteroides sp.]